MSKYYIGYSTDSNIRFKSSSGGIGTAVIQYLMNKLEYGTAMTFIFNKDKCKYELKLIYDFAEYNNCGSVYQDTDTIGFIRNNIDGIRNGIIITCMPCQVRPIRDILKRNNIKHFVISLCCSGQTTVQGTWCYYSLLGIHKEDVDSIQYRGNGWPSGIQINLSNGRQIKYDNYTYPWTLIHKSLLFRPKRCLFCTVKTSSDADISLADPWLKEYLKNDVIGHSVVICNFMGESIIHQMAQEHKLEIGEVDERVYIQSQLGTIQEKAKSNQHRTFNRIVARMVDEKSLYKKWISSSAFLLKLHLRFLKLLKQCLVQ